MQYCRGGKKSKRFSPGSDFTDSIFTGELSGVDSALLLKHGAFTVTPSPEVQPTKTKETPSTYKTILTPLDAKPVFQCLKHNPLNRNANPLQRFRRNVFQIHFRNIISNLYGFKKVDFSLDICNILDICVSENILGIVLTLKMIKRNDNQSCPTF